MKIFKIILGIILTVALSVTATALISRATDGFNTGVSDLFYNKDNLIRTLDEYVSQEGNDGNGITWTVKSSGAIIADGKLSSDEEEAVFMLGSIDVTEKGFYTLSGAPKGTSNSTYYIKGTYQDASGASKTIYADYQNSMTTEAEIPAGTMVTFSIVIVPGVSVDNVKFSPSFVLGKEAGAF